MASIVERTTGSGQRRLYVTFSAVDRTTSKRRKIWELVGPYVTEDGNTRPAGRKDANAAKARIEVALKGSGGLWPLEEQKDAPLTVAAYSDTWLDRHAREVTPRVIENYCRSFRLYITPKLGTLTLDEIRRRHVQELVDGLVDAGMARNSIRNVLAPVRRMFRQAVRDELVATNPAADIDISDRAPVRAAVVPTPDELAKIRKAAGTDARDAIDLMAALGLRRGELFALRWADVDLVGHLLTVRATNHRGVVVERTKTKAGLRLVPLFPSARRVLEDRRGRLDAIPHPTAFVFANAIGGALDPGNWSRREWKPALKTAGFENRFHIHDLRHYAATMLDESGLAGKLRTEIIGHANEDVTNSIYTHIRRERVAALATSEFDPLGEAVNE